MSSFIALECIKCGGSLRVSADRERFTCNFCGTDHLIKDGVVSLSPMIDALKGVKGGVDRTAAELAIRRIRDDVSALQIQLAEAKQREQQTQKEIASFAGNWVRPRLIEINRWLDENKPPKSKSSQSAASTMVLILFLAGAITISILWASSILNANLACVLFVGGIFITGGVLNALQNNKPERKEYFQTRKEKMAEKRSLENGKIVQGPEYQAKYTEKQKALSEILEQQSVIQIQVEKKWEELGKHEQIVNGS